MICLLLKDLSSMYLSRMVTMQFVSYHITVSIRSLQIPGIGASGSSYFVVIFILSFDRVSDQGVARPLGVEEGADRNILRHLESGLSFSTDWTRKPC